MCGICGFVTAKNIEEENLIKMNNTMIHRGPNDSGVFLDVVNGMNIGLAHRRLSILDLSPMGHQPMFSDDSNIVIVFNGEIYNFKDLRLELENKGYKFKSNCDTEVIIYSYKEWGLNCFNKFNGMFALTILDKQKETIYLARDRMGKKPLYYYYDDGDFVFSSELKGILNYKYFKKEIDSESIYKYLIYQYIPTPRSIYKNVFKLYQGSYLEFDLKRHEIKQKEYWSILDIYCNSRFEKDLSEKEYLDQIEKLLKSSIEYRMISDVPLGAFLSGGIDSSLIVSIMKSISNSSVKTFSIGFTEEEYNEASYAKAIAEYIGTDHHEMYVSPKDVFNAIPLLTEYYDEPFADSSALPTLLVSNMAKQHVTVTLSGDAGDELFCGYTRYDFFNKTQKLYKLPYLIRKPLFELIGKVMNKELGVQRFTQKNLSSLYRETVNICSESLVRKMLIRNDYNSRFDLFDRTFEESYKSKNNSLESIMLVDIRTYILDDILTKLDRASMAVSLESRVPFLDYRLVEFSQKVPSDIKFKNSILKYPLKTLLGKYVPPKLFERPKKGFGIPIGQWLRNDLSYLITEYFKPNEIRQQGIFNDKSINNILREHMEGRKDYTPIIWSLLMFQMWFKKYI
ncbi:MAG: asparagine synthase (glutamine-hydrolyzing) [Bacillota bacterium]